MTIEENWQILDYNMEHEQQLIEINNPTTINNNNNYDYYNDNNNSLKKVNKEAVTDSDNIIKEKENFNVGKNKYIEINPLGPNIHRYSKRLIYLCTAIYSLMPLSSIIATFTLLYILFFTRYYFITILYLCYLFFDRNTCNKGGSRVQFIYKNKFWSYLAAYFPIKLRYTNEFKLSSDKNYILNYHPHGISAFGAVTVFSTNGLNFNELFPGIKSRFMVHETSFVMPIMKETFAFRGDCSVNSKSFDFILNQTNKGNLLCLVGGGLAEADLSHAEILKIVVAKRKGFIKKALIHGAYLIPCIAFGENSVFHKVNLNESSFLHKLESKWYKIFKFKHPIYYGRSILSDKLKGIMPFKRPITVVMGNPIPVERIELPNQKQIDDLHLRYLNQLKEMYNANIDLCSKYDTKLELL